MEMERQRVADIEQTQRDAEAEEFREAISRFEKGVMSTRKRR